MKLFFLGENTSITCEKYACRLWSNSRNRLKVALSSHFDDQRSCDQITGVVTNGLMMYHHSYKWLLQFKQQVGKTLWLSSLWRCHTSCWMRTLLRTPTQTAHREAWQLHRDRCPGFLHLMARAGRSLSNEQWNIFNHLITSPVDWFKLCTGKNLDDWTDLPALTAVQKDFFPNKPSG